MNVARRNTRFLLLSLLIQILFASAGCDNTSAIPSTPIVPLELPTREISPTYTNTIPPLPSQTATAIATPTPIPIPRSARRFVPILAYHHIRNWLPDDSEDDRAYIVPAAKFEAQLKYLKEKGYHTATAQQIYEYYAEGRSLPDKPIMLSFDDGDVSQYTIALPLLRKYSFNATFFIMTVTLDKENYMTAEQIKELDKDGYDVQPHTWDHHMVTKYKSDEDWQRQMTEPKKTLEELLGHPTPFFAYPFGIYDSPSAEKIKSLGYRGAFRLSEIMDDKTDPLFAIKRYIANGYWTIEQFETVITGGWE